ncbi:MAG TPA: PEP-CTERM sorting domain-containing protein [Tepidisphaeraceae bacterium]|jgi:hypothetical protein
MKKKLSFLAAAVLTGFGGFAQASAIFDDFNLTEGHFNLQPTFSSTTTATLTTSTADRVTTDAVEGAGSEQLVFNHDATTNSQRVRFLSGSGTVANNTAFNVTSGTDGYIGLYLKTTASGWKVSLALDGADGVAASMDGGVQQTVNNDGNWHLYQWNLDNASDWGAVTGIGGGHGASGLANTTHTIDSIMFYDGTTASSVSQIQLDFVATNDQGSVENLVPEPGMISLAGLAIVGLIRRRHRC